MNYNNEMELVRDHNIQFGVFATAGVVYSQLVTSESRAVINWTPNQRFHRTSVRCH